MSSDKIQNAGVVTFGVMLATIMQAIDTTIANVALPHMQGSLSATLDQVSWVVTSYVVAAAIMTPPTGWLAARFGRKRVFVVAILGFTATSVMCGMANTLPQMVLFRILQGVCGASLVPLSQAVLLDSYPPEQHSSAMAIWGVGIMVGPIIGPSLGGYFTETLNWRWVFFINLPIGLLAAFILLTFSKDSARSSEERFDWFGFTSLSIAIGSLQLMLDRGQHEDWFASTEIMIEGLLVVAASYYFLVHTFTTDRPFIKPALFRDRNFSVSVLFIFLIGTILLATMVLLPPFMQGLLGYPVITVGWILVPRGVGTLVGMILVARVMARIGPRAILLVGLSVTAWSMWIMSGFSPQVGSGPIVFTGILQGLGLGFLFVPLSTIAFSTLPADLRGEATAIFNLARHVGSSVGVSLVITVLARSSQVNHMELGAHINPYNAYLFQGREASVFADPVPYWQNVVQAQSEMIGYLNDFKLMMFSCLIVMPLLLLLDDRSIRRAG